MINKLMTKTLIFNQFDEDLYSLKNLTYFITLFFLNLFIFIYITTLENVYLFLIFFTFYFYFSNFKLASQKDLYRNL